MTEHAYKADEPSCMNCQSTEIENVYTDMGQFKGSWCKNCGVMNHKNGLYTRPERLKE